MLDNILYTDINGLILDINVSNSGSCTNVLYKDILGYISNISMVHTGSINSVLYPHEIVEIWSLVCDTTKTYSRSRVVNR